jgi:hypothetical protein
MFKTLMRRLPQLSGVGLALALTPLALGRAVVTLNSSAFLKEADTKSSFVGQFSFEPIYKYDGSIFTTAVDAIGIAYVNDPTQFTADARELYIASSPNLWKNHQISFGRKIFSWMKLDEEWQQGTWEPRFTWDPLFREQLGLVGGFYEYERDGLQFVGFMSPFWIPQQGAPGGPHNRFSGGGIPSTIPNPAGGGDIPLNVNINMPPLAEAFFKFSGAAMLRYQSEKGFWIKGAYGYTNIPELLAYGEAKLLVTADPVLNANVTPVFLNHHIATIESGYESREFSFWGSLSGDVPDQIDAPDDQLVPLYGEAIWVGAGGEVNFDGGLGIDFGLVAMFENQPEAEAGGIDFPLPGPQRSFFRRAWRLGASWRGYSPMTYRARWTYDQPNRANWFQFDLELALSQMSGLRRADWAHGLFVGIGADLFSAQTNAGPLGARVGDDRLRMRLAYAF